MSRCLASAVSFAATVLAASVALASDRTIDANYTLTGDEVVEGVLTVQSGVTVDLNSCRLAVRGLAGEGTITSALSDLTSPDSNGERVSWCTNAGTTSEQSGGGLDGGTTPRNLFNNNFSRVQDGKGRILVSTAKLPLAVTYDFGANSPRRVNTYKVYCGPSNDYKSRWPKVWSFEGSNDNSTWTTLDSRDSETGWSGSQETRTYPFKNDSAYRYYRITFKESNESGTGKYLELVQLEFCASGVLCMDVPKGECTTNSTVAISGDVSLVKTGAGEFATAKADQTYSRGTVLADGTYALAGTTSLDLSKFTFGTDPGNPVTLDIGAGATLSNIPAPWNIGDVEGMEVTVRKTGGSIAMANAVNIGNAAGSSGTLVVDDGGIVRFGNDFVVGNYGTGTLTINDGTVEVDPTRTTNPAFLGTGSRGTINLNGGVFKTKRIAHYKGAAYLNFNGGTLQANASNNDFIKDGINVTVNCGVIDSGNNAITIAADLTGTGGLTFTGGNKIMLNDKALVTYSGRTCVTPGTTLVVYLNDAKNKIFSNGLVVVGFPKVGDTIFTLTRGGGYTISESQLANVTCPLAPYTVFELGEGNTNIVVKTAGTPLASAWSGEAGNGDLSDPGNWYGNSVPTGDALIYSPTNATLTIGSGTFAPSSITFADGCASVTINGDALNDIVAVTNRSCASHTINAKVYFTGDIQVNQMAMAEVDDLTKSHVTFAGGAYAAPGCAIESGNSAAVYSRCIFGKYFLASTAENLWTARYQSGSKRVCVADRSYLYVPYAGALTELYVGENAKVDVGSMEFTSSSEVVRLSYQNKGEMVVTNVMATGTTTVRLTYGQGKDAPTVFRFDSITNSFPGFYFSDGLGGTVGNQTVYIGACGLNFLEGSTTAAYCIGNQSPGNYEMIRPWYSDFTIADRGNSGYAVFFRNRVEFCTDDESGIGRTITLDAITKSAYSPAITVSGTGTLKVNRHNDQNDVEPSVTVTDSATLEYAFGASLGTGALALGAGTTLVVDSGDLPLAVASLALPASGQATIRIKGELLADGDHEILVVPGGLPAGFSESVVIEAPEGTSDGRIYTTDNGSLRLFVGEGEPVNPYPYSWTGAANDGNHMSTPGNWLSGEVPPNGAAVFIPTTDDVAIDNDLEEFKPSSITFGYGSGVVTIGGNALSDVVSVTNLSVTASHVFEVPVCFSGDIQVKQAAMADVGDLTKAHVTFAGGAYAASGYALENDNSNAVYSRCVFGRYFLTSTAENRWTVQYYGSTKRICIADDSYLNVPYAGVLTELYVGNNAEVHVGNMVANGRIAFRNYGKVVITNMTASAAVDIYVSHSQGTATPGKYYLGAVTNGITGSKAFRFADANGAGKHEFYIGEFGMNYSSGVTVFYIGRNTDGNYETIRPWYSDFTIGARPGDNPVGLRLIKGVEFCTDDDVGVGRTITLDAVTAAQDAAPTITVSGSGRLRVNKLAQNSVQPTVTVKGAATLAYKPGASLGTGVTTVNTGATLAVGESGSVMLGGDLTLANNACLGFDYTSRDCPTLDLTGKAVTFAKGASTNIVVKISAAEGARARNSGNVLTAGGGFTGVNVTLAEGYPEWVTGVGVNDEGNIVIDVKPSGLMLLVK